MHGIRVTAATGTALLAVLAAGCGGSGGGSGGSSPSAAGPGGTTASATATGTAPGTAAGAASGTENGIGQSTAPEVLQRAVQALKDAGAVRAVGTVSGGGSQIGMDLRMDTAGNCTGTLSQSGTGSFQVVKSGQQLWVKPDLAFWQSHGGAAAAELVGDRYLKTTADNSDFAEIGDLCDLGALADQLGTGRTGLAKGAPTTVQGRPALPLTSTSGTTSGTGTLYVASTGSPVPLRLEKATGTVDFSDFGTPVPSGTPGPAQSLDLDQLQSPAASSPV
ncbi:hypothetical protein ACIQBJ_17055 [Kitasatospora sp. NPDC088391]|uniref:hypothetical protein n=1 Tax=Kitasatospora sp. NPDC088391 TaxID=3364074 RepID=UPI0037F67FFD